MAEVFGEKVTWYQTGESVITLLERLNDEGIMPANVLIVQAVVVGLMAIAEQVAELRRAVLPGSGKGGRR